MNIRPQEPYRRSLDGHFLNNHFPQLKKLNRIFGETPPFHGREQASTSIGNNGLKQIIQEASISTQDWNAIAET